MKLKKILNKRYVILAWVVAICVVVAAVIVIQMRHDPVAPVSQLNGIKMTHLNIESEPAGIEMRGVSECDSAQLHKTTPYDCTIKDKDIATVITAPQTATVDNKIYIFKAWDGCIESNSDRSICKAEVKKGESHKLKAAYEPYVVGVSPTQSPKPSGPSVPASGEPRISCSPINYGDYPNGGCGLEWTNKMRVVVNYSFAPDCNSYHAGIEIRCRNQAVYYPGSISPMITLACNADPKVQCNSINPSAENNFDPGYYIIRFPSSVTFTYTSNSGPASLGNLIGSYNKQTNTIDITASYVSPVKDESYPKCCSP